MITNQGKTFIKRQMAGQSAAIVGSIAVGVGTAAPQILDKRLEFEYARSPVNLSTFDFVADELVYKATLGENVGGMIYEIGLWTSDVDPNAGNQGSRIITSFDSGAETWVNGTFDVTTVRMGEDSLKHTPAAGTTQSSSLPELSLSFIENSAADLFSFAYSADNANVATIKFRFKTDATNYYEFTISNPTAGYKITSIPKGSATVVGTPAWDDITEISVDTTAKAGGLASISYDGIRTEDVDTVSPEYGLVARHVLATPILKEEGRVLDIEYALKIT